MPNNENRFEIEDVDLPWSPDEGGGRIIRWRAFDHEFQLGKKTNVRIVMQSIFPSNLKLTLLDKDKKKIGSSSGNRKKRTINRDLNAGKYYARVNGGNPPRTVGSFTIQGEKS